MIIVYTDVIICIVLQTNYYVLANIYQIMFRIKVSYHDKLHILWQSQFILCWAVFLKIKLKQVIINRYGP
jgi:hypothetical protein